MRCLILSDIHGNLTALDAALAAAEGRWDRAVCLGDVVGYGPDPNEVIERIAPLAEITIRGNHDKAIAGVTNAEDFNPVARAAVEWSRTQLRPKSLAFLKNLPAGPVSFSGARLVHGSGRHEDEYLFTPEAAMASLQHSHSRITFFGHTHIQGGFSLRGERLQIIRVRLPKTVASATLKLEKGAKYLLNPGSVGQPRDDDARAGFIIADWKGGTVEYWRIPYDVAAVQDRMTAAGLPQPLIERLAVGW